MLSLALAGLQVSVALMVLAWLISVLRRDVGIVDTFWAIAVAGTGVAYAVAGGDGGDRGRLAVVLALAWMLRLSWHILRRNWGQPEDRRYREIRARNEPGFWWKSSYLVFAFQSLLAWLVGLPLLGAIASRSRLNFLDAVGVLVWLFGMTFEMAADRQLARFQADPLNHGRVMDQGLWRYSRHPNYFGEFCIWWGMYLVALAGGAWWSAVGPALLTFFLLKVSGVALTEKDIATRRPEYRQYMQRTSAFFPRRPTGTAGGVA
jgi:steroid 5-alpha reductase family enzyme